jgi:serine/threonine-protein kinase
MRSCPQCRQILVDSAAHCPDDGKALCAPDSLVGELLSNQYQLLEKIGEGASGTVYRGWQFGVERMVAIKILSASAAASAEFVARFLREAQAAARLSHPNIVTVYHIGKTASKLPFIAMEWVPGGPLGRAAEHRLRGRFLDIIAVAKQVASALAEAHRASIIHRDLKPDNLLFSYRRGRPTVTVVDFGIAKILDEAYLKPGETHLTKAGMVYGTPQYLSPEQASGKCVDARSDLYSLGVVLYQLLSGRLPFEGRGVALLVDHISGTPPALQELVPEAPAALTQLIMSMLAKEPADRPQSAADLCSLLDDLVDTRAMPGVTLPMDEVMSRDQDAPLPSLHIARTSRRARVSLSAAMLALIFMVLADGRLSPQASAAASETTIGEGKVVESDLDPHPRTQQGSQRALMVSADGYSLRVLVPEKLRAGSEQPMAIEVWDRHGRALSLPSLVILFADRDGQAEGVTVPAGDTTGRYEVSRQFASPGSYSMQVLTEDAEVALRVHFDVLEAASPPNS